MIDENEFQRRMQRITALVEHLDSEADPGIKAQTKELVGSVMDLHGEALERILQRLRGAGEAGATILDSLAGDPVVSSVLLLHNLHPRDFETRVRRALETVRPSLRSYGTDAELIGIQDAAIRIRLRGVDNAFTARTVKSAIEAELDGAAPDATSLVFEGLEKFPAPDFVPLEKIGILSAAEGGD